MGPRQVRVVFLPTYSSSKGHSKFAPFHYKATVKAYFFEVILDPGEKKLTFALK